MGYNEIGDRGMVDKISNYILDNILYKNEKIEGDKREVMLFGITRIVEDIPKYFIIFLIALSLDILMQLCVVLAITIVYKTFVGGAHARTNIVCLISSIIFFISPVLLAKYVNFSKNIMIIASALVFIFSVYVIIRHAPADTEEVPILNKNKRKLFRVLAFISLILVYMSMLLIKNKITSTIILITLTYINFFATNPMYKFYKCKHSYESDEFKEYYNEK